MSDKTIKGFSKLSKKEKIQWIVENFFNNSGDIKDELVSFWHEDEEKQKILDGISVNTITNFPLPYGVAPNFLINEKLYVVPMVIEESSVVAAASAGAKYWMKRGGIKAEILGTTKIGHVHFNANISTQRLKSMWNDIKSHLISQTDHLTKSMQKRGGGIKSIQLKDFSDQIENYYQVFVEFETCDSMGANFINSILEEIGHQLESYFLQHSELEGEGKDIEILMAILSNLTPECLVKVSVSCPVEELASKMIKNPEKFARRIVQAVKIAEIDPYRASTHNKGIFNGVDAVVIATGNDFRAVESAGHTYASLSGQYKSLSSCSVEGNQFQFSLTLPLAIGTVGGLTALHPIAKLSLELLGRPSSEELMMIIASVGLAQNFSALRSLVTTGIQEGHMKMHLKNILNHLQADNEQILAAEEFFKDKVVSFAAVRDFLS